MQTPSAVTAFFDGLPDIDPQSEDQVIVVLAARRPNTSETDGNLRSDTTGLAAVVAAPINVLNGLGFPSEDGHWLGIESDTESGSGSFTDYAPEEEPES